IQRDFQFPWTDDVLVPCPPALGLKELVAHANLLELGRTKSHVILHLSPWTFWLEIDSHSRFPNVETVIPKSTRNPSRLTLAPADVAALTAALAKLTHPGETPITLDLSSPPAMRVREGDGPVTQLVLSQSTVSGPPVRLCTDRLYLHRALQ